MFLTHYAPRPGNSITVWEFGNNFHRDHGTIYLYKSESLFFRKPVLIPELVSLTKREQRLGNGSFN